jgi:hypothetical protein
MLLVVELARAKVKLETEKIPFPIGHDHVPSAANRVSDQLNDVGVDSDARVPQRKYHVDA